MIGVSKEEHMRKVEMRICWPNDRYTLEFVEIPADTADTAIQMVAKEAMIAALEKRGETDVADVEVSWVPGPEEVL